MILTLTLLLQQPAPTPKIYRAPAVYAYYAKRGPDPKCDGTSAGTFSEVVQVENGHVIKQQFLTGDQALFEKYRSTIADWRYDPQKVKGESVDWVSFVSFSLSGGENCRVSPIFYGRDPREIEKELTAEKQATRVSGGVAAGNKLGGEIPRYPEEAKEKHITGSVVLAGMIGTDGTMNRLVVVSGHPLLAAAALQAVQTWKYRPYTLGGQPVIVETTITVNFNIG